MARMLGTSWHESYKGKRKLVKDEMHFSYYVMKDTPTAYYLCCHERKSENCKVTGMICYVPVKF